MGRNTLLSAGSTLTAAIALVLGVVAVATPYWATFTDNLGNEQGHFGAWTLCRERDSVYRCGPSRLRPTEYTAAAGVCGIVALLLTLVVCVMSPLVLAMRVTRRQLFVKFRHAVLAKLVISCVSVTCCMLTLILFGIDVDGQQLGRSTGFQVTRGWSYYLLVVYTLFSLSLTGFAAAEFVLARRLGGDPVKMSRDPAGSLAPVIVNPSVAKHHHQHHQLRQLQLQQQLTAASATGSSCFDGASSYSSNGHGNGCAVAVIDSSCPPAVVFQRLSGAAAGPLSHHATYSNRLATLDVKAAAAAAAAAASGGGSGGGWGGEAVDNERVTSHNWMTSSNIGENATATSAAVRQTGQPLAFDPRRQPLRSSMKKRPHATARDPASSTATDTATGTNSNSNSNNDSSSRMAYSVSFDTAPRIGNSSNNINNNSSNSNNNSNHNSHIQFADEGVVIIPNRQAAVTAMMMADAAVHDQLSPAVTSYSSVHSSGGSIRSKKVRIQTLDTPV